MSVPTWKLMVPISPIAREEEVVMASDYRALQAKLAAVEAINKHNIEDECELEDMLVKAGIPDYEPSGDYKGLMTQMAEFISAYQAQQQRITALEDSVRTLTENNAYLFGELKAARGRKDG